MRIFAVILLLCVSFVARAATGDVLNGAVLDNGWMAVLRIEGGATNGTFDFGYENATNHVFNGDEKLWLNVNSPGYSRTTAETNIFNMKVFGTWQVRWADPSEAFPRTAIDGSDVLVYIALNDFVFSEDTGLEATIAQGLYTSSTATNEAASITLTNWSLQPYPKVISNWSDIPFRHITSTSMVVKAVGFHASGGDGQPLAAMQFFATDEGGTVLTNTVSRMSIDSTEVPLSGIKIGEYISDFDLTTLTENNQIRVDFRALPRRGNPASVFDTRDNTFTWPSYLPQSRTNFYNTDALGGVAVVSTTGNDSTGVVHPAGTDPTTIDSGDYFLTGSRAANGISTNNNTQFSLNDVSGGVVYLKNGITTCFGSAAFSFGDVPSKSWITFKPYPGDTVTISTDAGTDDISDRVKVHGITLSPSGGTSPFNNIEALWFDDCIFASSGSAPFRNLSQAGVVYVTDTDVTTWTAGLPFFSTTEVQHMGLLRGCKLDGMNSAATFFNAMGNRRIATGQYPNFVWRDNAANWSIPTRDFQISYSNYLMGITNGFTMGNIHTVTNGQAMIQTVFEVTSTAGQSISVSSTDTLQSTNMLWINSVVRGARNQWQYNAIGSTGAVKNLNYAKGNIFVVLGEATDITDTDNAGRTNNWSARWRVGGSHNIVQMTTGAPNHGDPDFNGMNSFRPPNGQTSATNWPGFVDDDGRYAGGTGDGNGNYRLLSKSPILDQDYSDNWIIPFDLDGQPRGRFDPPGAFVAGNARRGAFF